MTLNDFSYRNWPWFRVDRKTARSSWKSGVNPSDEAEWTTTSRAADWPSFDSLSESAIWNTVQVEQFSRIWPISQPCRSINSAERLKLAKSRSKFIFCFGETENRKNSSLCSFVIVTGRMEWTNWPWADWELFLADWILFFILRKSVVSVS